MWTETDQLFPPVTVKPRQTNRATAITAPSLQNNNTKKPTGREKKKNLDKGICRQTQHVSQAPQTLSVRSGQVGSGQVGNTFQMTHAGTDRKWRGTRGGHAFLSILTVSLFTALPLQMKQPTLLENLCILPV